MQLASVSKLLTCSASEPMRTRRGDEGHAPALLMRNQFAPAFLAMTSLDHL